jgi:SAM-dependent methyltransferase
MKAWHVKLLRDNLKMAIPFQGIIRRWKRSLDPYRSNPKNDSGLIRDSRAIVALLERRGIGVRGADVVEIGSGWVPALPLTLRSAGARKIITLDQERLMDAATFRHARRLVAASHGASPPPDGDGSQDELLADSGIDYRAPARFEDLPDACADVIVSRAVLEHIPEPDLRSIARQSIRVLKPGGAICHLIDMSDHWEHNDKTISRINFLRYEQGFWRITGINPQNYQNRLRGFEYARLFEEAGFRALTVDGEADADALKALKTMTLCARYRSVPHHELAVLTATIVARAP